MVGLSNRAFFNIEHGTGDIGRSIGRGPILNIDFASLSILEGIEESMKSHEEVVGVDGFIDVEFGLESIIGIGDVK